jgi:PadR family transcriptional regulator, regulatory protein PadR
MDDNLPLTEPTFLILLSLAPAAKHGYAIMKEVAALSDGRVQLSTGTLYGALKRLLAGGWIERVDEPDEDQNGRDRKAYRLTDRGRAILEAEASRMRRLAQAAAAMTAPAGSPAGEAT